MRRAMADAKVGDDVYGEDPTVNRLQELAAETFEREAALFVPSGTMANQIALKIYLRAGQEVICEERAHIFNSELGMIAGFAGGLVRPVWAKNGILTWDLIAAQLRRPGLKYGSTGLIALENTSNFAGGTIYPIAVIKDICERARGASLPVFLDGARVFNAAVALSVGVSDLTRGFDSLMFSLSKGLGAPVGSILLGTTEFIEEARQIRKMLGGAMRQAGILAAAGLLALTEGPLRLNLDHENARFLATGIAEVHGLRVFPEKIETNIMLLDTRDSSFDAPKFARMLANEGVLVNAIGAYTVRLVTHRDVSRADCELAVQLIRRVAAGTN
jgi:threonine aldolase